MFVHKSDLLCLSSKGPTLDLEIQLSKSRMLYKKFRPLKGRDRLDMVFGIREKTLRIHLILMRDVYGVQFLNKSVKSFVIFHQLFQSEEETFFLQFLNNMDKTLVTKTKIQTSCIYIKRLRKILNLYHLSI